MRVRAPATSANLGPGFDCLGLALDLWNEVEAVPGACRPDPDNLILRAAARVFDELGSANPGFKLRCTNRIPFSRGLGSSAAAIVCGVLLANHCLGAPLSPSDCLRIATELEGHPDNVTPCLSGGVCAAVRTERGEVLYSNVPLALELRAVLFIPEISVTTVHARALLPATVAREDALFNVARSSLLVAALASGRADLLAEATRDRLHQPFRLPMFPAGATLLRNAMDAGALGAFSSGAGPSVLALCDSEPAAEHVRDRLVSSAREQSVAGTAITLELTARGAYVD
ncbi:MAG: homoserine kinase [Chloroflexi bacterium]|nr:homoserine kinase [Chloroflexota bacterium]